ncbi:zinc finger protein 385D-like isoform X1 [Petromyzon marinus]|uniref:zinc finger protein 385D-like isoform X1 n=1 Tax=Petromyzon marinus TaxID=7757 RepID=UPI003F6EB57C
MILTGAYQAGGMPAVVRAHAPMLRSGLAMKPFFNFPLASLGFYSNFHAMDPMQKAVLSHSFGVPNSATASAPRRRHVLCCNICQIRFNSESQSVAHYKGTKHSRRLQALEGGKEATGSSAEDNKNGRQLSSPPRPAVRIEGTRSTISAEDDIADGSSPVPLANANGIGSACPLPEQLSHLADASNRSASQTAGLSSSDGTVDRDSGPGEFPPRAAQRRERAATGAVSGQGHDGESEEERAKRFLYCSLCKVAVNSQSQLDAHNKGSKHKMMMEARNGGGAIKAFPRLGSRPASAEANLPKGSGLQDKTFYCEICDVHVNSETQLKQHITSRRHKDRIAGKPIKPKFSPYNKIQGHSSSVGGKLPPGFLPTSLAGVRDPLGLHGALGAAAPPASTLTFHVAAAAPPPPLLRAAPGPIRSSHRSMLFTPY